jgi:signal transduction histidine kinase
MNPEPARAAAGPAGGRATRIKSATWVARVLAFALVNVLVLKGRTDHRGLVVAALVAVGVLLVGWGGVDLAARRGRPVPTWVLMVVLAGLGTAAGLVTALPVSDSVVAFAVTAAIGAGSELPTGQAGAVVAMSILAIEVSALSFGFNNGDVGWPLAVVAGVLAGRQLREARVQSYQAVALVAQTERTRAEEQRAATLDERARIAREIHDLLAHSLGALGIQLEAAHALLTDARDIDRAIPLLDQSRRLAASGLEETRRAIEALRTDTPPLPESVASLAESHSLAHHSPVQITVTGTARPLSPDANLALIRTTHEALVNAAKHAPAASIDISLDYGPDTTTVTVTNLAESEPLAASTLTHGAGGPGGANGGYGLAGMRERLLLIGGTLTAGPSEPGWTVRADIPL